jgi:hypothetical protein
LPHPSSLWTTVTIAGRYFQVLDLDHQSVTHHVFGDIEAGIKVYYDQRWAVTERFCHFLLHEPGWVAGRDVLILGAGIGIESVIVGSLCTTLYINDSAPGALALCAQQLRHNGIVTFVCLPGRFEHLSFPPVDLIIGCFLVYNRDTARAVQQLLARTTQPVLLMNDNMPVFRTLLRQTSRIVQPLLPDADKPCVLLTAPPSA